MYIMLSSSWISSLEYVQMIFRIICRIAYKTCVSKRKALIYCPHNSKISALFWTNPLCIYRNKYIYIYYYIIIKGSRLLLRIRARRIQQLMQHPGNQCRSFFQAKITRCISPFSSQAQLSTFETTQN